MIARGKRLRFNIGVAVASTAHSLRAINADHNATIKCILPQSMRNILRLCSRNASSGALYFPDLHSVSRLQLPAEVFLRTVVECLSPTLTGQMLATKCDPAPDHTMPTYRCDGRRKMPAAASGS